MKKVKLFAVTILTLCLFGIVASAVTHSEEFSFGSSKTTQISSLKFSKKTISGKASWGYYSTDDVDINMTLAKKKLIFSGYDDIIRCWDMNPKGKKEVGCRFTTSADTSRRYDSTIILNSGSTLLSGTYSVTEE